LRLKWQWEDSELQNHIRRITSPHRKEHKIVYMSWIGLVSMGPGGGRVGEPLNTPCSEIESKCNKRKKIIT
jgi:hypothetical protein